MLDSSSMRADAGVSAARAPRPDLEERRRAREREIRLRRRLIIGVVAAVFAIVLGYALALLVEAATGALAGYGRADPREGWGATAFVQVLDPAAFGGTGEFDRQIDWVADACRKATPRPGGAPVRLPGERGMQRYREQRANGVTLFEGIMASLAPWAEKLGVTAPKALA